MATRTCPVCGKPVGTKKIETIGITVEVAVRCDCDIKKMAVRDAVLQKPADAKITGLPALYRDARFPDSSDDSAVRACRAYVDAFDDMKTDGAGLDLWGPVGPGKTHLAACIAHAVREKGSSVLFIDAAHAADFDLLPTLQRAARYDIVILDDVGVEADTSYRISIIYRIVNDRINAKKPLVITTNLDYDTQCACIQGTHGIDSQRIWDRIYAKCSPVRVNGIDHRKDIARGTNARFAEIMKGEAK